MRIVYNESEFMDVADKGLSLYDSDTMRYRMVVWQEDGILHVMFFEPVVIATEDNDLIGGKIDPELADESKVALPTFDDVKGIYED
jgi:hypothetical protein